MKRKVIAFFPGKDFPSISVTGGRCDLQCDHCRGRHLRGMIPVSSPGDLLDLARGLEARGGAGFLLSGGCGPDGRIPLEDYHEVIGKIKRETDLAVNVHTGLLDRGSAASLVRSAPDCLSVDIVQDERVISDVLHLRSSPRAYEETLDALFGSGARVIVPHICVGLSGKE
ncbi:MAG: radical SAM protein, partial [Euryarchaeota archaeon]|nr:radical SAM protein [Euryarchaeota archaeon]